MTTTHTSPAAGRKRDPETIDIIDNLQHASGQLESLLTGITSLGEHFRRLRPDHQDAILDVAYDLAVRVREAAGQL